MYDTKKLETLSYKPECNCVGCREESSAGASPATLGFNSAVIKPELSKETIELKDAADQHLKELEQPNLKIIAEIEGLISQVNDRLGELVAPDEPYDLTKMGREYISKALEEIDLFQKTTLFELRKAFE